MATKQQHIDPHDDSLQEYLEMISRSGIEWEKSKEQIWSDLEKKLDVAKKRRDVTFDISPVKMAIAAAVLILIGLAVFMQVYQVKLSVPAGKHLSLNLPDNSKVRLNAQSELTYKPLIWKFSRKIKFEGEAYFEVKHGKKFSVISAKGTTMVMGTSINILSLVS